MPLQVAQFRGAETVPIGDQDHGRVTMAIAARLPRGCHQLLDFGWGERFARPANWGIYDGWRHAPDCLRSHDNPPPLPQLRKYRSLFPQCQRETAPADLELGGTTSKCLFHLRLRSKARPKRSRDNPRAAAL